MPDCSEYYQTEISEGRNKRVIKCKFCSSVILTPSSASFTRLEVRKYICLNLIIFHVTMYEPVIIIYKLPHIRQTKGSESDPETEDIIHFWAVEDMMTFYNVGFSNTVGNTKYLTCADCEAGPIGYHDIPSKMSYVALSRVLHSNSTEKN
ncbi:guanine nucleotide exchange factor MSS4 homolog isoform X1 [Sitophilus oryzae]|uniref:Guanine nucleotide exchange factor MSS4 homolog isoform X1 n=1 Tax=Sitophilus oryzae TaxID=7048 RepID=A0A6J2XAA8_SITOR|nr:guanine nucleotide exchange factor MSS4 homolog isoform X1 [Sitophilus oryzae]